VGCWSIKQKLVTKSSSTAEVVAVSDGWTNAIWMRDIVMVQRYVLEPTKIYEDNQGVIKLMKSGMSPKQRTKHMNIRYFFVRDRMKKEEVVMVHMLSQTSSQSH
jgi:hypothetical protein